MPPTIAPAIAMPSFASLLISSNTILYSASSSLQPKQKPLPKPGWRQSCVLSRNSLARVASFRTISSRPAQYAIRWSQILATVASYTFSWRKYQVQKTRELSRKQAASFVITIHIFISFHFAFCHKWRPWNFPSRVQMTPPWSDNWKINSKSHCLL